MTQPTISAFFKRSPSKQKRTLSPIDLTTDGESPENEHLSKRFKASQPSPSRPFEQWSFAPSKESHSEISPVEVLQMRTERHEAFKKKFLQADTPSPCADHAIHMQDKEEEESEQDINILTGKQATVNIPRTKKRKEIGPSGQPYTPLELQVLQLKKENPRTVLMIEVGYKYKFFGDDAKVASKELGMVAYTDRNFLVASIPTERRDVHLKKLLSQGYKVGIVGQVETAALKKVGTNRNAPFERQLLHLYTAATFVDKVGSLDDMERFSPPLLLCLIEERIQSRQNDVRFGFVTVCPSTGDVVWDDFEDTPMRIELETRLAHTTPTEFLLPAAGLSEPTKKLLSHFASSSMAGKNIRTENFDSVVSYDDAFDYVSDFYVSKRHSSNASESVRSGNQMARVVDFPKRVTIALAHILKHLSTLGIAEALLETEFFDQFTSRVHMLLAANTLSNLEVFRNETDFTVKGSLLWVLDNTRTKFGARMLKHWISRPLVDKRALQERASAVEEILESSNTKLHVLRDILKDLPDLAKGLCRIQYGQCTPEELAVLLPALNKVANAFIPVLEPAMVGFKSEILNNVIFSLPKIKESVKEILDAIVLEKASQGEKESLWSDPERYPAINDTEFAIRHVEAELTDELRKEFYKVRKLLRLPSLQWMTIAGDEYIIELNRRERRPIPDTWILHTKTKTKERYRTPEVVEKLMERTRYQEILQGEANKAYHSFLQEMSSKHYTALREAVTQLATADCIISFAHVALRNNYVRPELTESDVLEIVDGRHPMIEALRHDPFVPNSINMGEGAPRSKIITGPNMGGLSSSVRMVALIAIMAQVGSYVPATSVKMGLLDSILTRMGASDDLAKGQSTFMVEMSETRDILSTATSKSLVILDELGRGTSTFDGMAIADAVLHQLVETTKCKTLFITHYPLVASSLECRFPRDVENLHMDFEAQTRIDGKREVTFLYRLVKGLVSESFGIECGRLAGLPESVLGAAVSRASNMQTMIRQRTKYNRLRNLASLLNLCLTTSSSAEVVLKELKYHLELLRMSEDSEQFD
ncbi:hypothetical protein M378DRAFT_8640 [Amanita muscaria Koide BX008]|uniref:DNA mismatch repair protein MSH3 n=1 Tax=Amanita muscaria (strain Koide BX008) TaxID=946122 RepID=A0A0C2XI07_AMAMK|nr:hypothetical protein M378DRAFT_8640 [Amanita muscaria Koide BX008]